MNSYIDNASIFTHIRNASLKLEFGEAICDFEALLYAFQAPHKISSNLENSAEEHTTKVEDTTKVNLLNLKNLSTQIIDNTERELLRQAKNIELPVFDHKLLKEILNLVDCCQLNLDFAIPPFHKSVAFIDLQIPKGHFAHINLIIEDGLLIFNRSHGQISPPIKLPMAINFTGLTLNKHGEFILGLKNFPDLNISKLALKGLSLPHKAADLANFYNKSEKENTETHSIDSVSQEDNNYAEEDKNKSAYHLENISFNFQVKELKPKDSLFKIGNFSQIHFLSASKLYLKYNHQNNEPISLNCDGFIEVKEFHLQLPFIGIMNFCCEKSVFSADFSGEHLLEKMAISLKSPKASIKALHLDLKELGNLQLKNLKLENLNCNYTSGQIQRYQLNVQSISGEMYDSRLKVIIAGKEHYINIDSAELEGHFDISNSHYHLNLKIQNICISAPHFYANFKQNYLNLGQLHAQGFGHIIMGSDYGMTFSGELDAKGTASSGSLQLGNFNLLFGDNSASHFKLKELSFSDGNLQVLAAEGTLQMDIASGTIPLFNQQNIHFSEGAKGLLQLENIMFSNSQKWPRIIANLQLQAHADAFPLRPFAEFPAGSAYLKIPKIELEENGLCTFSSVEAALQQRDRQIKK